MRKTELNNPNPQLSFPSHSLLTNLAEIAYSTLLLAAARHLAQLNLLHPYQRGRNVYAQYHIEKLTKKRKSKGKKETMNSRCDTPAEGPEAGEWAMKNNGGGQCTVQGLA